MLQPERSAKGGGDLEKHFSPAPFNASAECVRPGPLRTFAQERLLDGLTPYRIFDRRWLERLVNWKLGGLRPRRGVKIWLLLTLEAWLRTVYGEQR